MTYTKQANDDLLSPSRRSFLKKGAGFTFAVGAGGLVTSLGLGDKASAAISEDSLTPNPTEATFYLTSGNTSTGIERLLGFDSSGSPRPNDNPCP